MSNFCTSQTNIRIDDSLAAHAEVLDLHMGHVFMGKVKKFHFGQYKMDTYKSGHTYTKNRNNFLGTKRESNTSLQSSFILRDSSNNAAQAVLLHHTKNKTQQNLILGVVDFGEHETESLDYFTSWITINGDSSDTWTLFIGSSTGIHVAEKSEAFMTNGKRNIILQAVTAGNRGFNRFGLPSMGYEFIEDGHPIAAFQFF
ncbi:MAG TPA: hypothetical protein VMZ69_01530, partial [Saprospiraceae bacterium]|nr:hypothetical protein [Saprospiraceae bacterium]